MQLELFRLDDQLVAVEQLIRKVRKSRSHFDASELASAAVRVMDIIADPTGASDRWSNITKMGVVYATEWCLPGKGAAARIVLTMS
jgi:hypothetical protein